MKKAVFLGVGVHLVKGKGTACVIFYIDYMREMHNHEHFFFFLIHCNVIVLEIVELLHSCLQWNLWIQQ